MNNYAIFRNFTNAAAYYRHVFKNEAIEVKGNTWQGSDVSKRPEMVTYELPFQSFKVDLGWSAVDIKGLADDIKPNLPWADDHFEERVCGWPINPGKTWEYWPWNTSADTHRDASGMFNHNYMERLWPKFAAQSLRASRYPSEFVLGRKSYLLNDVEDEPNHGIRLPYGDLTSLVTQLANDPLTRQAVIPLYFPEDTGAEGRKPCTLLYQFMMRNNRLHMYYPLRSCDFVRHWRDDCYLAMRLLLWVLDRCRERNKQWNDVVPGEYHMHMTSFHIFKNDLREL
jgi:hypothetical protein